MKGPKARSERHPSVGAVVHDYFAIKGGGEKLMISLANQLGADIITGYWSSASYDKSMVVKNVVELTPKWAPRSPSAIVLGPWFLLNRDYLSQYNWVIFSGNICVKMCSLHIKEKSLYYCHTPPRYLYDKYQFWMSELPQPARLCLKLIAPRLRKSYERALSNIGRIICNSYNTKNRLKVYTRYDSEVIHPGVDLTLFRSGESEGYYLSTARHDALKRVSLVVAAFKKMGAPKLVVASSGPQTPELQALAEGSPNITFAGPVSDEQMINLLAACKAVIYVPEDEDFGMSSVEAHASGKPVIAAASGGTLEIVEHGKTGILIEEPLSCEKIVRAVERCESVDTDAWETDCKRNALRFSVSKFCAEVLQSINAQVRNGE